MLCSRKLQGWVPQLARIAFVYNIFWWMSKFIDMLLVNLLLTLFASFWGDKLILVLGEITDYAND